jgi:hypothetical protein
MAAGGPREPFAPTGMQALRDQRAGRAADGRSKLYKTCKELDDEHGRKQHKFPPPTQLVA